MQEIPNKTKEIAAFFQDSFQKQHAEKLQKFQIAKQYAQDLMEGKIIAPDTNNAYPLGNIYYTILESGDEAFALKFLDFYINEQKKKQSRTYWDKYVIFPAYVQFNQKYPRNTEILIKILEYCAKKDFPLFDYFDNYWFLCYENPFFYMYKDDLPQYTKVLNALTKAIEAQKGKKELKNAEIERINSFKILIEKVIQNPIHNQVLFSKEYDLTFLLTEFCLPFLQIEVDEIYTEKQILEDAKNVLLLLDLMQGENQEQRFRKPIPFQELTTKKIHLNQFLGVNLEKETKKFTKDTFQVLGELSNNKLEFGLLTQLFYRPYAPSLKDLPYLPKEKMKESEIKLFFLELFTKDYLLLDLNKFPDENIEIWSFSTNTSHFFDAGNEWFGSSFWAIHNKKQQKVSFLLASFTD